VLIKWSVPQEESDPASTDRAATADGEDVKEEVSKEVVKEEMPEHKKVIVDSSI